MRDRIAVLGTGISGLTCAHLLNKHHDVTVFEANDYIGGHTATVDVDLDGTSYAIDTGFIVFNDWTYPNFIRLLEKLNVSYQPTEMSFSVKNTTENLEYNGNNLNTLFAQRRNLLSPRFYRIVADILRFNKLCKKLFEEKSAAQIGESTLGEFLQQHQFSDVFSKNYILPMCAAIWSGSLKDVEDFPLAFFLQFFNNHGLLNITDRPQWFTILGGSKQYIPPLIAGFSDRILLNKPVQTVIHTEQGIKVIGKDGSEHSFDKVIFACHSDQALNMLNAPTKAHQQILGNIAYTNNEVVLHTDTSVLPKRRLAWASWNYLLKGTEQEQQAPTSLTYNMNILQRLDAPVTFCVTLNNSDTLDDKKILKRFVYAHPQFNQASIAAQKRKQEICGVDNLYFCGAYWHNGFHEDGVRSALDVCEKFGVTL